jgi:cytochrome c oxidase subunit 2
MRTSISSWPAVASTLGKQYDLFFWLMVLVCGLVTVGIAIFITYSAIRYRRRRPNEMGQQIRNYIPAEVAWIATPFLAFMGMFAWGAKLYMDIEQPPDDTINMYVVAKQWMWKVQHPKGQREINELHIPVGRPVKLIMTSQDVIHSFFVPAFRTKQDVLPDRYTTTWFQATKPGKYHLFCAEYCGSKHSGMIGWIYAMTPSEYQQWLEIGAAEGSLSAQGEKLFHQYGCANCHHFDEQGRCPNLIGLYNHPVELKDLTFVKADDTYIRQKLLDPRAQEILGFDPIMPTFKGLLSEEQIIQLIAYIKAIGPPPGEEFPSSAGPTPHTYGTQKGIAGPGVSSISTARPEVR